jgi:hypothetical protein
MSPQWRFLLQLTNNIGCATRGGKTKSSPVIFGSKRPARSDVQLVEMNYFCSAETPRPNISAANKKKKTCPSLVGKNGGNYQMKKLSISTRDARAALGNICSMERIEQEVR